jgi:hypothetical protein
LISKGSIIIDVGAGAILTQKHQLGNKRQAPSNKSQTNSKNQKANSKRGSIEAAQLFQRSEFIDFEFHICL